ncbi:MAG: hypothetical protein ACJ71R_03520 [Nitrososphaeraceae archaeon]
MPGIDKSSNTKHIYDERAAITQDAIKIEDPEGLWKTIIDVNQNITTKLLAYEST